MAIFDDDVWLDKKVGEFRDYIKNNKEEINIYREDSRNNMFECKYNFDAIISISVGNSRSVYESLGLCDSSATLGAHIAKALGIDGNGRGCPEDFFDKTVTDEDVVKDVLEKYADRFTENKVWIKYINFLNGKILGRDLVVFDTINEPRSEEKITVESTMAKGYKQVIFTGAPGTGKTYSVRKYVEENVSSEDDWKFVQFHPSYDYSDFVEGLRPVTLEGSKEPTFVRMDGTFKAFCRHIVEEQNKEKADKNKKYYFVVDEINRADLAKVFGELMFGLEESYRGIENRFDTQYKNLVTYEVNDEGIAAPMSNDVFEEGFYIPENLIFIGTMNDIDRSVESFDFALRRRFQWEEIKANVVMEDVLKEMLNLDDDILKNCIEKIVKMNEVLSDDSKFGLTEAYHIGPAYFKTLTGSTEDELRVSLEEIFNTNIVSIIKEYTRGRNPEDVKKLIKTCADKLGVEYKEA